MRSAGKPLLAVQDLTVTFPAGGGRKVQAVSGVSFDVKKGETLGLVGESGCGKSSTARAVVQLLRPAGGNVFFMGHELTALRRKRLRRLRPQFQMIFQDSFAALNPRRCVGEAIAAPLAVMKAGTCRERTRRAKEMMERVGIPPDDYYCLPHEFSGGQCQRIQIARALISQPRLLICDEPVSSLDVSIQAQILNLLEEVRRAYDLTLLFISHDLAVVKNVSDRVAVMYMGRLCEIGPSESIYRQPAHPYTHALLSAVYRFNTQSQMAPASSIQSEIPSPLSPPSGCRFRPRCSRSSWLCGEQIPLLQDVDAEHQAACHHPL
jgi:peptide/nickel transport system ATP-binding protein